MREAIENADEDTATYSDCTAGSGADTIVFEDVSEITFADAIKVDTAVSVKGPVTF